MKQIEHDEIKLRLGDMLFTWDDEKEKINIRKHGLDFTVASSVFLDLDAVFEDNSVDEYTGEERFDVIGMFAGPLMFVVYVERVTIDDDDIIRIISARDANREERKRYVNGHK
ncbi:MAG: BrnT family toxin [Synergistaceae bacterium]|nr:BrnT family toxin [Synergistaceae bacterium]